MTNNENYASKTQTENIHIIVTDSINAEVPKSVARIYKFSFIGNKTLALELTLMYIFILAWWET